VPSVVLSYNAAPAEAGATKFHEATERIIADANRAAKAMRDATAPRSSGGSGGGARQYTRQLEAQRKQIERLERSIKRLQTARDGGVVSQKRQLQAALTALSTLGEEQRAYAQLTRWHQRRATAMGKEFNVAEHLATARRRLAQLDQRAASVFSTQAVKARDLRGNMLRLANAVALTNTNIGFLVTRVSLLGTALTGLGGVAGGSGAEAAAGGIGGIATGIAGGVAAVGAAIGFLVKRQSDLEVSLDEVSAITGIVGDELDVLTQDVIRFATASTKSVGEVALAFQKIASVRPELIQDRDALNALTQASLLLSDAAGGELEPAVKAITTTLDQFALRGQDAGFVVDALAAGAKIGVVEIPQLAEGVARVGAIAKQAGFGVTELVAALELAGKAGLPLEITSRSLRGIILRLQVQRGLSGNLPDVLQAVADEALNAEEKLKLFGEQNIALANFLIPNSELLREMEEATKEVGVAVEQMNARLDNIPGAASRAKAAMSGLIAALSNTSFIEGVGDFVQRRLEAIATGATFASNLVNLGLGAALAEQLTIDQVTESLRKLEEARSKLDDFSVTDVLIVPGLDAQIEGLREAKELLEGIPAAAENLKFQQGAGGLAALLGFPSREGGGGSGAGGGPNELEKGLAKALGDQNDALENQIALARLGARARAQLAAEQKAVNEATKRGLLLSDAQKNSARELAAELFDVAKANRDAENSYRKGIDIQEEIAKTEKLIEAETLEGEARIARIRIVNAEFEALAEIRGENKKQETDAEKAAKKSLQVQSTIDDERIRIAERTRDRIATGLSEAFVSAFDTSRDEAFDFFEFLTDLARTSAEEISKELIIQPLLGLGTSGIKSLFSSAASSQLSGGTAPGGAPAGTTPTTSAFGLTGTLGTLGSGVLGLGALASIGLLAGGGGNLFDRNSGGVGRVALNAGATGFLVGGGLGVAGGAALGATLPTFVLGGAAAGAKSPLGPIGALVGAALGASIGAIVASEQDRAGKTRVTTRTVEAGVAAPRLGKAEAFDVRAGRKFFEDNVGITLRDIIRDFGSIKEFRDTFRTGLPPVSQVTPFGEAQITGIKSPKQTVVPALVDAQGNRLTNRNVSDIAGGKGSRLDQVVAGFAESEKNASIAALAISERITENIADFQAQIFSAISLDDVDVVGIALRELESGLKARTVSGKQLQKILKDQARATLEALELPTDVLGKGKKFTEDQRTGFGELLINFRSFEDDLAALAGVEVTQTSVALRDIRDRFGELATISRELDRPLSNVLLALELGEQKIRDTSTLEIEKGLLAEVEPLAVKLIEFERQIAQRRLREVEAAGGDLLRAEELNVLQRQKLIENETSPLSSLIDSLTIGELGGASVPDRLASARTAFEESLLTGDFGAIAGAGQSLIGLSRQAFASGAPFQQDVSFVTDAVQGIIDKFDPTEAFGGLMTTQTTILNDTLLEVIDRLERIDEKLAAGAVNGIIAT
jgi:TP901 family phage tail tape measure protein